LKIKMNTLAAGPSGVKQPGKVYDVSEAEAKELVHGRYAQYVDAPTVANTAPEDNSYDAETGELIGYCSIVPEAAGEEHVFGDTLYIFNREEEGKLYFSRAKLDIISLEAFIEMKAEEQKTHLEHLKVEGDTSNFEKRVELYAAYLEANK
jgi:hypothetical protein